MARCMFMRLEGRGKVNVCAIDGMTTSEWEVCVCVCTLPGRGEGQEVQEREKAQNKNKDRMDFSGHWRRGLRQMHVKQDEATSKKVDIQLCQNRTMCMHVACGMLMMGRDDRRKTMDKDNGRRTTKPKQKITFTFPTSRGGSYWKAAMMGCRSKLNLDMLWARELG